MSSKERVLVNGIIINSKYWSCPGMPFSFLVYNLGIKQSFKKTFCNLPQVQVPVKTSFCYISLRYCVFPLHPAISLF